MNSIGMFICYAVLLTACTNPAALLQSPERIAAADEGAASDFATEINTFAKNYAALEIPDLAIAYVDNLKNIGGVDDLKRQKKVLQQWREPLDSINESTLAICEQIDLSKARHLIARGIERADLGLQHRKTADVDIAEAGLSSVVLGEEWYEHYLKSWLGAEVSPDEIFAFGESQIELALSRYRTLQIAAEFEGGDAGFAEFLASKKFLIPDGPRVGQGFLAAQKIVRGNIGSQFYEDYGAPLVTIRKSGSEQMAAAPGFYNPDEETFYYNVFDGKYDLRERDWLFLHEATPGHHFQFWMFEHKNKCQTALPFIRFSSFFEGWAAYVETIGKELGLYQSLENELSAVEWDMVRSVRVALDVGLNYYGWSDEKALAYWRKNIQGKDDVAMREIARMRRWPAQVVTYKYGADVFLRAKASMAAHDGAEFDVRRFHNFALRYGDMPFAMFEALVQE